MFPLLHPFIQVCLSVCQLTFALKFCDKFVCFAHISESLHLSVIDMWFVLFLNGYRSTGFMLLLLQTKGQGCRLRHFVVPRLFEEKWRDTVFGFPWGVVRGSEFLVGILSP